MANDQPSGTFVYGGAKQDPRGASMSELARDALALVLAGGRGSRLGPLTDWRAKPAVPFGGKFRIIDFSLSNCVNSGVRRIAVLIPTFIGVSIIAFLFIRLLPGDPVALA